LAESLFGAPTLRNVPGDPDHVQTEPGWMLVDVSPSNSPTHLTGRKYDPELEFVFSKRSSRSVNPGIEFRHIVRVDTTEELLNGDVAF
jgi:hypothetical protein